MTSKTQCTPSMETASLAKSERDVLRLKELARFVIEINKNGNVSINNNRSRITRGEHYASIISVVAPFFRGKKMYTVPMLEIGYKRARPYKRVHEKRNKILIQTRNANHQLSVEQFETVYPYILNCLEIILMETTMRWKTNEPWFINGQCYERGVQITIAKNDVLLYQAMLQESIHYFYAAIIGKYVHWLNKRLKHSQFEHYSNYGPSVKRAAASVMRSSFITNPFWMEVLLSKIKKSSLLRNALYDIYGYFPEKSLEVELTFHSKTKPNLPHPKNLFIWHTPNQPANKKGGHAVGCGRFEILFNHPNSICCVEEHNKSKQKTFPSKYYDDPDLAPF